MQTDYHFDHSAVTLYTLNKHLEATLPIIKAIISDSIFPPAELDTFIRNQKQKLSVNLEKNDFVSRRVFNKALFGDTLYGYDFQNEDYDHLDREQLQQYFRQAYQPQNCTVIIAGKATDRAVELLNRNFGSNWHNQSQPVENPFEFGNGQAKEHYIEKPEALQSAIRIGRLTINRNHPDFPGLQVLNTLLGGYFGSRLMANIREDKGYTYGIGSAVVPLKNAGYFFIASEVGAEVCSAAIAEIEKELTILKQELVSDQELDLVRNFMLGSMLGSLENAFSHADKFKNIHLFDLGYDYYQRYIEVVRTISAKKILELANLYLNFDQFEKVIVGKK